MEEIKVNVAYRWFLGYTYRDELPYFSTVSYSFRHRFTSDTIEMVKYVRDGDYDCIVCPEYHVLLSSHFPLQETGCFAADVKRCNEDTWPAEQIEPDGQIN